MATYLLKLIVARHMKMLGLRHDMKLGRRGRSGTKRTECLKDVKDSKEMRLRMARVSRNRDVFKLRMVRLRDADSAPCMAKRLA